MTAAASPDHRRPEGVLGGDLHALAVRPPRQERSRQAWARVLDAGVVLLEHEGYDGFTIAAVCERAAVPPRALYARVDTKDALFLAVYEHGMSAVRADQREAFRTMVGRTRAPERTATRAVEAVAAVFGRHAALLRAVVLVSGAHPEVYRRGADYRQELGALWAAELLRHAEAMTDADPRLAVSAAFDIVFAQMVVRTAYGAAFTTVPSQDEQVAQLALMVCRYLFPL